MYTRLLLESLRRGTRRKLLAVSAVALGTLGATALAEVMLASGDRLAAEMSSYGANLEVVPAAGRQTLAVSDLPRIRKIFWRNNIVALAPFQDVRVRLQPGSPAETVAPLVGTWFDHDLEGGWRTGLPRVRPTLHVDGRWPNDEAAEIALGRRLAARLGLSSGGEVRVRLGGKEEAFRISGLLTSGGDEEEQAFAPLSAVQRLAGLDGRFTRAEVFALTNPEAQNVRDPKRMTAKEYDAWYCTAYPSSVAFQLGEAVPGSTAQVMRGITAATADVLDRLQGVLLALAVVALAGAAVGVTAAMTATVLERRLEAGLLIAIGAPRGHVVLFFLSEAALLGVLGGLLGGLAGLAGGRLLGNGALGVAVPWMPQLLPFAALLGLAVAVVASLAPVVRALELYPAEILKKATA
ncbi:MAG TPA: ABC transporter permease [Thermoanaerobaculia bacterium]|jgi:putative ABC transport system permease protein|nr:ABC transporter permease [Thermoanaerobaculia bacterium]